MKTREPVKTRYGLLQGVHKNTYTVYRGVPYAKPPVGNLRFCPPQPPAPWQGVYQATAFPQRSLQAPGHPSPFLEQEFFDDEDYQVPADEDCLYLNIWVPDELGEGALPVAFWVHGGAFLGGHGAEIVFDGAEYCRRGVILVTVNYRVGLLGSMAHRWLSERQGGHSGNYGIQDQIAALSWVRENIAAFGGNPANITVFGQSAGAISVQTLVSSPLTRGFIAGAILQSGNQVLVGERTLRDAEELGIKAAAVAGVSSYEELMALPAEKVLEATGALFRESLATGDILANPFTPVIDGKVLCDSLENTLDAGLLPDVPYMLGCTSGDMLVAGGRNPLLDGCLDFSRRNQNQGRQAAYIYLFGRQPYGPQHGAYHSAELWYTFGTLHRSRWGKNARDYALSSEMLDRWCAFMRTGQPNEGSYCGWQPYSGKQSSIQHFI